MVDSALPSIVTIGGRSRADLLDDLRSTGVRLNELALALFRDPGFGTEPGVRHVPIRALRVDELGRPGGATWSELMQAGESIGLCAAPLELAPHLRLQYQHQPEGAVALLPSDHRAPPGSITVVCDSPATDDDHPRGFYLRTIDRTPWLRGYRSHAGHVWSPSDVLLFACKTGASTTSELPLSTPARPS